MNTIVTLDFDGIRRTPVGFINKTDNIRIRTLNNHGWQVEEHYIECNICLTKGWYRPRQSPCICGLKKAQIKENRKRTKVNIKPQDIKKIIQKPQ